MADPKPYSTEEWRERLAARLEQTSRREASKRNDRDWFAQRRQHGLAARHRNKLNPVPTQRQETPVEPTFADLCIPTEEIGAKAWCQSCETALVYDGGPEGDYYWQHTTGTDEWKLHETTTISDRVRMFLHGRNLDDQQGEAQ